MESDVGFSAVLKGLTEELDPVDWATYETHLNELVTQHALRAAVILGPLGQLHPAAAPSAGGHGAPAVAVGGGLSRSAGRVVTRPTQSMIDADLTRSVVPLISGDTPRFHTLPVSMPVKQAAKKLAERPGGAAASGRGGGHDDWLPAKKSASARAPPPHTHTQKQPTAARACVGST
jgi:hypothetical protein